MAFSVKPTRKKVHAIYKTIYLSQFLHEEVSKIAKQNNTSFNNVVVSMIEYCLAEGIDTPEPKE